MATIFLGDASAVTEPITAVCTAAESVEDLVYVESVILGVVTVRTIDVDDDAKMPALGFIISKPDTTECVVAFSGLYTVNLTFASTGFLWAAVNAKPSRTHVTRPVSGTRLAQLVGRAIESNKIILEPVSTLVKLRPEL